MLVVILQGQNGIEKAKTIRLGRKTKETRDEGTVKTLHKIGFAKAGHPIGTRLAYTRQQLLGQHIACTRSMPDCSGVLCAEKCLYPSARCI